jgi:hypothetical protein
MFGWLKKIVHAVAKPIITVFTPKPPNLPNRFIEGKKDRSVAKASELQVMIPDNQEKLWNIFVSVTAASIPWKHHFVIGITSISVDVSIVGKYWQITPKLEFLDRANRLNTATIQAEYLVVPSKLSKMGIAKHNDIVLPPYGSTKDWNIIVSIHKMTNVAGIESISVFATENIRTYASWQITAKTFSGTSSLPGTAQYLIVPKLLKYY